MKYGVELEYGVPGYQALLALGEAMGSQYSKIKHAVGGYKTYILKNGWYVSFDPCLRRDGWRVDECVEIVSPVLDNDDAWPSVLDALTGINAQVSPRCGMHIHVDAVHLSAEDLLAICRAVDDYGFVVSPARKQYCRPLPVALLAMDNPTMNELWEQWYEGQWKRPVPLRGRGRLHPARHRLINLGSVWFRGTLEFRMFDSTLSLDQLKANLDIVRSIIAPYLK